MIVVLGAGVTGLAAAKTLEECGEECAVVEREAAPGGHCRSIFAGGYTFDRSGHFLHSSDPGTLEWILGLPGVSWSETQRDARVWLRGTLTPYPFQANLHGHARGFVERCIAGFAAERIRAAVRGERRPRNFAEWLTARFGREMCRAFFFPYNRKMWRTPLSRMGYEWTGWSVPVPRFEELLAGARGETRAGMGYNAAFRYPASGGIEALPGALARSLDGAVRTGVEVRRVDLRKRVVHTGGGALPYRAAISTVPLPALAQRASGLSAEARRAALSLSWVKVLAINLGVRNAGRSPGHWIYVPEPRYPFFRAGFLSNVASYAAPEGCASLFVEKSFRAGVRIDEGREVDAAVQGLRRMGVLRRGSVIEEVRPVVLDPAYVVFDAARRKAVSLLSREFARGGVLLAGRYGAWDYYGMERSIADGIRAARAAALVRG